MRQALAHPCDQLVRCGVGAGVERHVGHGDLAFVRPDGYLQIVDRKKDLIISGGENIATPEVEHALCEHPAVREASVVGVPDEYRGETVKAFVSLVPGASVSPEEIIEFCKGRMSAYKYPRAVEILPELPKNASGKLLRRQLRDK